MTEDAGVLTISLDTELIWGSFDTAPISRYADAYRATSTVISRLCSLFEKYNIAATWALVGHLVTECNSDHGDRPTPNFSWIDDWDASLPCVTGVDRELWFAPGILDEIQSVTPAQEIGSHGYTHIPLGEEGCHRPAADAEVSAGVEALQRVGVDPSSFVYPRNRLGHRDILAEYGFTAYRGRNANWYERNGAANPIRKPARFVTEATERAPPVVVPRERDGLIEIPGSQLFRGVVGPWRASVPGFRRRRALKGVNRAADTGSIFHLWCHPFNLAQGGRNSLRDFEAVLQRAATLRSDQKLEIRPMTSVAKAFKAGRWSE
jgi:hypothetical protein